MFCTGTSKSVCEMWDSLRDAFLEQGILLWKNWGLLAEKHSEIVCFFFLKKFELFKILRCFCWLLKNWAFLPDKSRKAVAIACWTAGLDKTAENGSILFVSFLCVLFVYFLCVLEFYFLVTTEWNFGMDWSPIQKRGNYFWLQQEKIWLAPNPVCLPILFK